MQSIPTSALKRVLVVDDDKVIRSFILGLLREILPPDHTVEEAYDGVAALEILRDHPIGIVLTDMRMTHMHGLQLIKTAQERWPWTQFVVLSNYDDFDYVKQSFLYGIVDYVLKFQLDKGLLRMQLEKAQARLAEYREKCEYDEKVRRTTRYEESLDWGRAIERCMGDLSVPEFLSRTNPSGLIAIRIDVLPTSDSPGDWFRQMAEEWANQFLPEDHLETYPFVLPRQPVSTRMRAGLWIYASYSNTEAVTLRLSEKIDKVFAVADSLHLIACIAREDSPGWDMAAMKRLGERVDQLFYLDHSAWIEPAHAPWEIFRNEEWLPPFTNALLTDRREDAVRILHRLQERLDAQRPPSSVAHKLLMHIFREMQLHLRTANDAVLSPLVTSRLTTFIKALEATLSPGDALEAPLIDSGNAALDALIAQITHNLANPVTLDEAARRIGFSRPHFCRIFKKATGESYNTFVTHKRMEYACSLLQTPGAQAKTVASAIGISDVRYFKKLFQQYMQIGINEYIRKYQKGNV